jgi:ABC-2 type transport system ATP-binding protein
MIEVKNLNKKIKGAQILEDISFSVEKGEILGFLGPNGAGKTTTLKIITSFWSPTSGEVIVDGLNVADNSLEVRKRIGYLPEMVPLYEEMLVYEYLRFIAQVRGVPNQEIRGRLKEVAAACGLRDVLRKPIDELSKGYRQRVGLAQAITHDPDILILDEPTTGLDPNQIVEIRDLIKKLGQEKTVIFSTHILAEVSATCDRAIIINKGKIAGQGSPDELTKKAGGGDVIYVKIKGPEADVKNKLENIENVAKAEVKDRESTDIIGYEVHPAGGADLREQLSAAVMQSGWSILEFSRRGASLEDVFRELTK